MRANVVLGLAALACPPETGLGSLTIGVDGHALGSYIQSLHVVTTIDGATATDTTVRRVILCTFPGREWAGSDYAAQRELRESPRASSDRLAAAKTACRHTALRLRLWMPA